MLCRNGVLSSALVATLSRVVSSLELTSGGLHRVHRLNVTPLEESGKRIGDIELAALCQTSQVSDRAPPIEKQKYPTLSARELAGKRGGELALDHAEHGSCAKGCFLCAKFHPLFSPLYAR